MRKRLPSHSIASRPAWFLATAALIATPGCVSRPVDSPPAASGNQTTEIFPQTLDTQVDLLFLVDSSLSMAGEQATLKAQFPALIEALRTPKLGPAGCSLAAGDCNIPDVHIGVITPDLGYGPAVGGCRAGGDQAKLLNQARTAGCPTPNDPWITLTNVKDSSTADPVTRIAEAFACIAAVGATGCGFEQQLEATRRALDPALNLNPGFVRPQALLAVVLITDEDDCSASNPALFDLGNPAFGNFSGLAANFRCFEYGTRCQGVSPEDERKPGLRQNCTPDPASPYLHTVTGFNSYETFFKGLKPTGRILVSAITGPPTPVEVKLIAQPGEPTPYPEVQQTCSLGTAASANNGAFPAIRISALLNSFNARAGDVPGSLTSICTDDFRPALREVGQKIIGALGRQCAKSPLLTRTGALACAAGDDLGGGVSCPAPGCLAQTDCDVQEVTPTTGGGKTTITVPKCSAALFADESNRECGSTCPCWRFVSNPRCDPATDGTPYALQIVRKGEPDPGTQAEVRCRVASAPWGSEALLRGLDGDGDGRPDRICQ
ncbi:MAG: hypothetical protein IPL40_00955 [Proteobacteria bacterium]|nr:hypothetical protein [Pseudomonadota bacterium]